MNHPDAPEDELLASARRILTASPTTFEVKPWRELMTTTKNAGAVAKAKEVKAAAKRVAKKTPPYKHEPKVDPGEGLDAEAASIARAEVGDAFGAFAMSQLGKGVDSPPTGLVKSNFPPTTTEGKIMTEQEKTDLAAKQAAEKQAAKEAATKAKIEAKEKANAEKKAAAEAKAKERAEAKAKRDAEKAAEKEAAKAEKKPRERTYEGSMLALSARVSDGTYVKGVNGQLRSNDDIAIAMESVPAQKTVPLLLEVLKLGTNPYAHLNYGQQSMNLRNRLRGAVRKGLEVGEDGAKVKVTMDYLKQVRDDGGYTAETETEAAATAA